MLGELVAQAAFAGPRLGHDADDLSVAGAGARQRSLQDVHLGVAPDETRQTAGSCHIEAGAQCAHALELEDADRLGGALDLRRAEIAQCDIASDALGGCLAHADRVGRRHLLHALRQTDGVPLRGVVHAQIVADLAHYHLAGVEPHAHREVDGARQSQFVSPAFQLVARMQRRVAGALRVVLVRDRRAEEGHDAVAGVLVHRPLEAVHAVGKDLEEAIEDGVPLLRIELFRQLHRALHVGEEDGHLLALAFEGRLGLEDFVGQVLGCVGKGGKAVRC